MRASCPLWRGRLARILLRLVLAPDRPPKGRGRLPGGRSAPRPSLEFLHFEGSDSFLSARIAAKRPPIPEKYVSFCVKCNPRGCQLCRNIAFSVGQIGLFLFVFIHIAASFTIKITSFFRNCAWFMTSCSWGVPIRRHDGRRRESSMPVIRGVPSSRGTDFPSSIPTSLGFVKKKLSLQSRPRTRPPIRLLAWRHRVRTRVRRQEVVNRILAGFSAGRKRFYNSRRKFPAGRKWAFEARRLGDKTSRLPLPDTGVIRAASRRAHRGGTSAVGNPLATSGDLLFFQATYTRPAQLPI